MKLILFYIMTIIVGVGIFLGINQYGLNLFGQEVLKVSRPPVISETFYHAGNHGDSDDFYDRSHPGIAGKIHRKYMQGR